MRVIVFLFFFIIFLHADPIMDSNLTDQNSTVNNTTESFKNTSLQEGKTDIVVVKGLRLEGQVVGLTSESLRFELIYGRGSILISFADIDSLHTQHTYHIFYNGKESEGRIVGIENHKWLITQNGPKRELIEISSIDRFILSTAEDTSVNNYLHNMFPFITGNIDLKIELEDTEPSTNELDLSARVEYARKRDRAVFFGNLEYDTKTQASGGTSTSKDEYTLSLNYNRYLNTEKTNFFLLMGGYEHDGMRNIDHRIFSTVGLGHRFSLSNKQWLDVAGGIGVIDEDFGSYGAETYGTAYASLELLYTFSNGIFVRGNMDYLPSLWRDENGWLLRSSLSLTMPLSQMFALKFSITDVDDNNPSPEVGNNKLTTDMGLSIMF